MTKYKLENSAIFKLNPKRAFEVLSILEMLQDIWKLNLQEAKKNWVTHDEWNKTQHFFLWQSVWNLERIREILAYTLALL